MSATSARRAYSPIRDQISDDEAFTEPLIENSAAQLHGCRLSVRADGSYSYAYGPPGLAGLAHNRLALACAVFASLGGLTFGYDQVSPSALA